MKALDYAAASAVELRRAAASGSVSAEAIVRAALERIAERDAAVHAWQHLDAQAALAAARAVDCGAAGGQLYGVPVAVKDILGTADMPTRYGSSIYDGFRPADDADCVARSRAAGAIVLGKTVTTEFAYFAPGPTANPHRLTHTPGGSSSGSAAAVADGMVPLAFGTQTAGSLIRPASYCGVFALKPTYGAFSLDGAKPFAPSLDTLGWLARSADDLELMRCALAASAFEPLPQVAPQSLRLGVCRTNEAGLLEPAGAAAFEEGPRIAGASGIRLFDKPLPAGCEGLMPAQKTVMAHEAARALAFEWEQHAPRLSAALAALIRTGRESGEAAYREALRLAEQGRGVVAKLMMDVDALLVPAAPGEAPEGLDATGDPVFSRVWTLLGLPCVNVPGLTGPGGLPIGLQLVGHRARERDLLVAAKALHRALVASRTAAP